ncbi:xanthine dehydrogenase family protein molybdopterin-binding subunit, partial [Pseudomonas carnis]|nr:xanthine dehydrogenase family protein molybdopterin-binding subunit [Pseudomonas carnis]
MSAIGKPMDRVDGLLKVTGQARYAGEFPDDGLLHGSVVSSTIAKGRVLHIDASKALALPGVVDVIHHLNRPKIASYDEAFADADAADGSPFRPLYNDRVLYSG